jgi:uncharacterized membrane protein
MIEGSYEEIKEESLFRPKDTDRLIAEGYPVNFKKYLVEGWRIFRADMGSFLIYAAIFLAINLSLEMIPVIGQVIAPVLMVPFAMGFFIFAAKKMKRQPTRFEDFFKGFNYFVPLAIVGILTSLLIVIGLFVFILPGIYLAVGYLFSGILIVDRKLTPWQAMETSRKIITKQWLILCFLALFLLSLIFVGTLFFIIGLIPATAIAFCILTAAYDDIIGIQPDDLYGPRL